MTVDLIETLGGNTGFGDDFLPRNDDASSVELFFGNIFENGLNFFGTTYSSLWVNNNGSVSFDAPIDTFTPQRISEGTSAAVFPYWADVDTRGLPENISPGGTSQGTNLVYYAFDELNDRIVVTWDDVGYFDEKTDLVNAFQLILTDASSLENRSLGDFDIEFRYESINWTAGDASEGSGGLGGVTSRAGYSAGNGVFFELAQSGNESAMLALERSPGNTNIGGLWQWSVINGLIQRDDDYLPGDSSVSFGSIDVGTPEAGIIEIQGDRDRFDVFLQAGVEYNILVEGSSTDGGSLEDPAIVGVYNILGGLVPGSSDDDSGEGTNARIDGFTVLVDSTYQIEVASSNLGVGDYSINVELVRFLDDFLPGPEASEFGSVLVGVPVSGVIEADGDRDRFEIPLQRGVLYNISLEGIDTGGGSLANPEIIGVFNSLGQSIAGGADNDGGLGSNALVEGFVVDADGTYQIEVASALAGNAGDYTLTVESAGFVDDFLPGIAGGFGDVSIGGRTAGEIEAFGDIDGFRVSLQADTTYEISILGSDSGNGRLGNPDLLGVFASGIFGEAPISSVQTLNAQIVGDDSVSYFTPQSAGEYFIGVQDSFGGTGTYAVAVENIGVRDDFAADIDTTGSIVPGGNAVGRIDFAQDNDWFEVRLAANRLYEIELAPTADSNALADPFFKGVYDSNGVLIQNTDNDDRDTTSLSSSLQFTTDVPGIFYLAAGGFGDTTGQYRLELNDLGPLDDNRFDITIKYTSDDVPDAYITAFEDAVERWEEVIIGDLDYAFVEGYGFVDDLLIEIDVLTQGEVEAQGPLTFPGVERTILATTLILDQRSDALSGTGALPTHALILLDSTEIGELRNLNELAQNTIGRALGFGSLWEEFGLVRDIGGVTTYTGPNALREMEELSGDLNGQNVLEDGGDGSLAAEYWSEANLGAELMTPVLGLRRPENGPAPFGRPDNPISELTIAAMQDLGYQIDYNASDQFFLRAGPLTREVTGDQEVEQTLRPSAPTPSQRLLSDVPDNENIPNGAALIYARPNDLLENPASFPLNNSNSELVTAIGTSAFFIAGVAGNLLSVELKGTFAKNNPASVNQLSGTVNSMDVYSATGLLLFSVDYSQSPVPVGEVISQWPNYSLDDENVIIVDSLDGTVARINPNGGGETASRIFAGASNDYVRGGDMAESINGGSGNDILMGSAGNDSLGGGEGIDTAVYSGDQSSYTLEFSPTGTTITDRRSSQDGTDTLIDIENLQFADGVFDIGIRSGAVGLSTEDFASIVELYIAYFNRAPAALGLLYWATRLEDGMALPEIAQSFFEQPEIQRTYDAYLNEDGSLNDIEAFVTAVFNNVLGRDPSGPYWINELENNPAITPAIFILSVLNGAKAPTGGEGDRAYLGDKTDVGVYFSAIKGLSEFEDTVEVMRLYDGSTASVNAAVLATDQIYAEALNPNGGQLLMPLVGIIDDPFAVA